MVRVNTTKCVLYALALLLSQFNFTNSENQRSRRGLLDRITPSSLPKVEIPQLSDLNRIQDEMNKLKAGMSAKLDEAIEAGKNTRASLENFIETMKDRIEQLENSVYPDEENYWSESNSCGGIMLSQSGKISYKTEMDYDNFEKCIWTIRANFRSKVKVQLSTSGLESGDYISITEINRNSQIRTVKLAGRGKYVFEGPLLLVTFVSDWFGVGLGFNLEFEGIGRNINRDVSYRHFFINDWSGSFSYENVSLSSPSFSINPTLKMPTEELTTMTFVPNYKNFTQFNVNVNNVELQPSDCEHSSITFYDNFLESNSTSRCCGTKCAKTRMTNNDGIFLATISRPMTQTSQTFQMTWGIETNVSKSNSVDTCGGTLSGRHGRISYKLGVEYQNNERCVWVIRTPGKMNVKMILRDEAFEDGYDFLIVSSIGKNDSGDDDMQTFRFTKSTTRYTSQELDSVIFLTFYSDSETQGTGFELDWGEYGDSQIRPYEHDNGPIIYVDKDLGSVSISMESETLQFIVFNPKYLDGSGLELEFISLTPNLQSSSDGNGCGSTEMRIFGNQPENFTLARKYCEEGDAVEQEVFEAVGGIFVVALKSDHSKGATTANFNWKKGSPRQITATEDQVYANQTDDCGGVLIGDLGQIDYRMSNDYDSNTRCTWVIESQRLSKMTLTLVKDGFESCCDFLIVAPLIIENGTLGESRIINRAERSRSFSSPVVFVTFFSDNSYGGRGFRLQFTTSGDEIAEPRTLFTHNVMREFNGSAGYTSQSPQEIQLQQQKGSTSNPFIITHVLSAQNEDGNIKPVNIALQTNNFSSDNLCNMDSLSFFQIRAQSNEIFYKYNCQLNKNECQCSASEETKYHTFSINEGDFISIFKGLESNENSSFYFNWTTTEDASLSQ